MFDNLRIGAKLAVGFGAIVALFVLLLVALGLATGRLVDGLIRPRSGPRKRM